MFSSRLLSLATLALTCLVRPGQALTLGPVVVPTNGTGVPPTKNITLNYGSDGDSLVNVSLTMRHPTVLLEDVDSVSSVDCSTDSVTVVFNATAAFTAAAAQWSQAGGVVLVTNHLGDCDAELERGFFLASSIEATNSSLTIVASTVQSQVNETAAYAEISFSSIPSTTTGNARRAISWTPSFNISDSLSLSSTTLYEYDPYLTITADSASLSSLTTVSGHLKFSILKLELEELYVDFDTDLSADLAVTVDVEAEYNYTASYTAPTLSYSVVNVPGIITLGPALEFAIGVDLAASGAATVTADVGLDIADGNVHIDFTGASASSASGWTPTYHAEANITETIEASIDPFVDLTVELACNILGGLLDLSVGLEAEPRFNNDFVLTATQDLSASGTTAAASQPTSDSSCEQGLEITSEFVFSLIAKVTQFWSDTIYTVTVPIADECYSWL